MRRRNIVTDNWQLKLLAVAAAIFLWLYVGITANTRRISLQKSVAAEER